MPCLAAPTFASDAVIVSVGITPNSQLAEPADARRRSLGAYA
jgi:hypothetical protein